MIGNIICTFCTFVLLLLKWTRKPCTFAPKFCTFKSTKKVQKVNNNSNNIIDATSWTRRVLFVFSSKGVHFVALHIASTCTPDSICFINVKNEKSVEYIVSTQWLRRKNPTFGVRWQQRCQAWYDQAVHINNWRAVHLWPTQFIGFELPPSWNR